MAYLAATLILLLSSANAMLDTKIPTVEISKGVFLPMAGLGTWLYNESLSEKAVLLAMKGGYTHVDTAYDYDNAEGIGRALRASGRARDSYFITSKVPGGLNYSATVAAHHDFLSKIGLDRVDLLLVHYPGTMEQNSTGSKAMRQEQWRALESLHQDGLARSLGISHYCRRHVMDVLEIAKVPISVNQVQYHVGMGKEGVDANDDMEFDRQHGILYQSFSPLCGPCGTTELIDGPLVTSIGAKYNKTGAQVSLKWLVQQGIPVIPKTANAKHLAENIDLFGWELSKEEMTTLTNSATPPVSGAGTPTHPTSGDCVIP